MNGTDLTRLPINDASLRARISQLERHVVEMANQMANANQLIEAMLNKRRNPWAFEWIDAIESAGAKKVTGTLNHSCYRGSTTTATSGSTTYTVETFGFSGFLPPSQPVQGVIGGDGKLLLATTGNFRCSGTLSATYSGTGTATATGSKIGAVGSLTVSFTDPLNFISMLGGSIVGGAKVLLDWNDFDLRWEFLTANACPTTGSGGGSASLAQIAVIADISEVML